ncbi:MAG: hypothetical protein ACOX61_07910 [Brooklawnia sp.]
MNPATTLAAGLRAGGAVAVAALLRARPDLTHPAPADLIDLAARAMSTQSTARAMGRLHTAELRLLSGLAAGVPEDLLTEPDPAQSAEGYAKLSEMALIVGEPPTPTPAVRKILGPHPAGLAAASDQPMDREQIEVVLTQLGPAELKMLEVLAWSGTPHAAVENARRAVDLTSTRLTPVDRLLGLVLRPVSDAVAELPREIALHVRGGRLYDPEADRPPLPELVADAGQAVDEPTISALTAWLLGEMTGSDARAVLEQAADQDHWVRLAHAREDGTVLVDVVRVLLIAHGSAYLVRRAGPRLNVPLNRVVAARLSEPVVINDLPVDAPGRRAPSTPPRRRS